MADFPARDEVFLGITSGSLASIEGRIGNKKHKMARYFKPSMSTLLSPDVLLGQSQGRLPVISFKPSGSDHRGVINGDHDNYFKIQGEQIAKDGRNIILCYGPEAESGDEWERFGDGRREDGGSLYGEAFNHVIDAFGDPPNIRWTTAFAGGMVTYEWVQNFWPGDAVDYCGSDPYNWCAVDGRSPGNNSFEDIVQPTIQFSREIKKPVLLLEMASWYKDDDPSFREQWIRGIADVLEKRPRIKGVCWFDSDTHCDWRLSPQPESVRAWGDLLERFGHL